jgi:hypothetical protein
MNPGAQVFLTTPCGETRGGSRNTNAYETPEHVQFFTEASIRLACQNAGFAGFEFRYVKDMYPSGGSIAALKAIARPILIRLTGPRHLTGFTRK